MACKAEKRILKAAMEVVSKEKISGTRMHMIAKAADVSQASIYYHFPTKSVLMNAMLDNLQASFSEERKRYVDLTEKTTEENIRGFFEQKKKEILSDRNIDPIQMDFWVQGTGDEEIGEKFRTNFRIWRESIEDVLGKKEIEESDRKLTANLMISIMLGASIQYLIDEDSVDLDGYFQMAEKLIEKMD